MTKEEFLEIQSEVLSGEKLLKSILVAHGVPYSTYNYWHNKIIQRWEFFFFCFHHYSFSIHIVYPIIHFAYFGINL